MNSIEELVRGLKPVRPAPSFLGAAGVWTIVTLVQSAAALLVRQPMKEHTPVIVLAGLGLTLATGYIALGSASPHEFALSRRFRWLSVLWPAPVLVSLMYLPLPTGALLLTPLCVVASVLWSLPASVVLIYFFARGYPLRPLHSAFLAGLAAASLGALAQNIVCVQIGGIHRLVSHVLPALFFVAGATPIFRLWIRSQRT